MITERPSKQLFEARQPMLMHEFNWKKEVLGASEPVLVDFWASWCPPCRAINPVIESLARDFKVCKVNVDTNQELAAHYGISSIPALLIFKDGKIAARHVGVTPEATLRAEMEKPQ
jgi:thioredoxin 1